MKRRTFLLAIPASLALYSVARAETDVLAASFDKLSATARLAVQEKLSAGGFYSGGLDGA